MSRQEYKHLTASLNFLISLIKELTELTFTLLLTRTFIIIQWPVTEVTQPGQITDYLPSLPIPWDLKKDWHLRLDPIIR